MGIQGLTKLISDNAPSAIKENEIKNYFGRRIAIDASMSLYQFIIAVRTDGMTNLTDEQGETTSHLQGMFHRTIRMIANGIKPCFVFDGKAPELKLGELAKRREKREEAETAKAEAIEVGDAEAAKKLVKRTERVTQKHNEETKRLLKLLGVPIIEAPSEAEAQCAALAKAGLVYATGSEDMDSLTLGTPILLRHLTFAEARKMPIKEIHLQKALEELKLNMDEFIDLCILLGCDYCPSIRGIGPVRALELIRQYRNLETIVKNLDPKKYTVPEDFHFEKVRELFRKPAVLDASTVELKWTDPDEDGVVQFLVGDKGFAEERVRAGLAKLKKARGGPVQGRITSFFGEPTVVANKRKQEEEAAARAAAKHGAKKAKGGAAAAAFAKKKK